MRETTDKQEESKLTKNKSENCQHSRETPFHGGILFHPAEIYL